MDTQRFKLSGTEVPFVAVAIRLRVREKMGTGSGQPVQNPDNMDDQPVPVPIFSQTLSPFPWCNTHAGIIYRDADNL